tara:strand:- start:596 stop:823 length:228 start_codon:yes stop_codon:yes gene_type:complete
MLLTFNKQNFEILECVVLALFFYMVYTIFIRDKLEAHSCAGHKKERFTNMRGMLPMTEGLGHKNVEGYGYGHKRR